MPTVIDSLIVKLGLDIKDIKTGTKAAVDSIETIKKSAKKSSEDQRKERVKTDKEKEKSRKKELDALNTLSKQYIKLEKGIESGFKKIALTAVAGFAGKSIIDLGKNIINTTADVGRLSKNLGISANELAKWQNAVRQVGGEGEDASETLMGLQRNLTALKFGRITEETQRLAMMGVSQGMTKDESLLALRGYFSKVDRSTGLYQAEQAGISTSMFNLLTNDNFERIMKDATDSSKNFESISEKSQRVQERIRDIQQNLFDKFVLFSDKAITFFDQYTIGSSPSSPASETQESRTQVIDGKARNVRNLNPGNIVYGELAKKFGGTLESGVDNPRFAKFASAESGVAALYTLLVDYQKKGLDTIEKIVPKYAPSSDGNDVKNIIEKWSLMSHIGAGQKIDLSNVSQAASLMRAITAQEGGGGWLRDEYIYGGIEKSGAHVEGNRIVHIENVYVRADNAQQLTNDLSKMAGKTGVVNQNVGIR